MCLCLFCENEITRREFPVAVVVAGGRMHDDCHDSFQAEHDAAFGPMDVGDVDDGEFECDPSEYDPSYDAADYGWDDDPSQYAGY